MRPGSRLRALRKREAELAARERRVAEREAAIAVQQAPESLDEEAAAARTRDAIQATDERAAACRVAAIQSLEAAQLPIELCGSRSKRKIFSLGPVRKNHKNANVH